MIQISFELNLGGCKNIKGRYIFKNFYFTVICKKIIKWISVEWYTIQNETN